MQKCACVRVCEVCVLKCACVYGTREAHKELSGKEAGAEMCVCVTGMRAELHA